MRARQSHGVDSLDGASLSSYLASSLGWFEATSYSILSGPTDPDDKSPQTRRQEPADPDDKSPTDPTTRARRPDSQTLTSSKLLSGQRYMRRPKPGHRGDHQRAGQPNRDR